VEITKGQLQKVFGNHIDDELVESLNSTMESYGIDSTLEVAAFLAQIGHESGGFKYRKENLNYSVEGLLKVFPKYFNSGNVASYGRKPEKIANRVYANRMGNGDESSGDGFRFCGRGFIQITGKENYLSYADHKDMSLDSAIEYLETIDGACDSAGWFWWKNQLDKVCHDITKLTKRINGGVNGLADRKKHFEELYNLLDGK